MKYEFTINGCDKITLFPQNAKEEMLLAEIFAGEVVVDKAPDGKQYTISNVKKEKE